MKLRAVVQFVKLSLCELIEGRCVQCVESSCEVFLEVM